jgi:hypothetical protein
MMSFMDYKSSSTMCDTLCADWLLGMNGQQSYWTEINEIYEINTDYM